MARVGLFILTDLYLSQDLLHLVQVDLSGGEAGADQLTDSRRQVEVSVRRCRHVERDVRLPACNYTVTRRQGEDH